MREPEKCNNVVTEAGMIASLDKYKAGIASIDKEVKAKKAAQVLCYVDDTEVIALGDVVTDKHGNPGVSIRVESRQLVVDRGVPTARYTGVKLTTKGVPYKNGDKDSIIRNRVLRILREGKEVAVPSLYNED